MVRNIGYGYCLLWLSLGTAWVSTSTKSFIPRLFLPIEGPVIHARICTFSTLVEYNLLLATAVVGRPGPLTLTNAPENAVESRGKAWIGLEIGVEGFRPEHYRSPRPPDASNLLVLTFSLDGP